MNFPHWNLNSPRGPSDLMISVRFSLADIVRVVCPPTDWFSTEMRLLPLCRTSMPFALTLPLLLLLIPSCPE